VTILIACLGLLPLFLPPFYTGLFSLMFIFAIFAMSLDILQGYTGLPSLGHAAFMGTAAYTVAILNVKVFKTCHFGVEFVTGVLSAGAVAAILGLIVLRSRGTYLLMILMASSMMLWGLLSNGDRWPEAMTGFQGSHDLTSAGWV
jgi:branched-chain amino acid transport system permease protein